MAERKTEDVAELLKRVSSGRREGLYYAALVGLRKYDPLHVIREVKRGIPYTALERFQRNTDLPYRALADLVEIPERTLARRKAAGRLGPDESDRLLRASRIFARALELFDGSTENARRWLTTPRRALGDQSPLELAKTEIGAIEVENLIGRVEHGVPA